MKKQYMKRVQKLEIDGQQNGYNHGDFTVQRVEAKATRTWTSGIVVTFVGI